MRKSQANWLFLSSYQTDLSSLLNSLSVQPDHLVPGTDAQMGLPARKIRTWSNSPAQLQCLGPEANNLFSFGHFDMRIKKKDHTGFIPKPHDHHQKLRETWHYPEVRVYIHQISGTISHRRVEKVQPVDGIQSLRIQPLRGIIAVISQMV